MHNSTWIFMTGVKANTDDRSKCNLSLEEKLQILIFKLSKIVE